MFTKPFDPHWAVPGSPGEVRIGDDDGRATYARHDDFQHVQRIGYDRAGQHVLDGERLFFPDRTLGVIGVDPLIDDDLGHHTLVIAIDRRITLSHLAVRAILTEIAIGN